MPRRQRWQPVKGTGNRVYDTRERILLGILDAPGRAVAALLPASRDAAPDAAALREVLVFRLDRIGDVVMSLPALADLRAALPAGPHPAGRGPLERRDRPERARGRGARLERAVGGTARRRCRRPPSVAGPSPGPGRRPHRPRPRPSGRRADEPPDVADRGAATRGLREHGRCVPPPRGGAAGRDGLLGGAEPPGGGDGGALPAGPGTGRPRLGGGPPGRPRSAGRRRPGRAAPPGGDPSQRRAAHQAVGRRRVGRGGGPAAVGVRGGRGDHGLRRGPRAGQGPPGPCACRGGPERAALPAGDPGGAGRARPLPVPGHRAHAPGVCGGDSVGERVRPLGPRALLLGRGGPPRRGAPGAVVLPVQPDPQAARGV